MRNQGVWKKSQNEHETRPTIPYDTDIPEPVRSSGASFASWVCFVKLLRVSRPPVLSLC